MQLDRESFRSFIHDLWAVAHADGEPHDPSMILGLRALRIYTGEESVSELLTNPASIIEQLEAARSPSIPVSDPTNSNSAFSRRSIGSIAAERTREFSAVWKHNMPPPKKKEPPAPQQAATTLAKLPVCVECKQPFTETDPRFIPGSPVGTCCGDKVLAKVKK